MQNILKKIISLVAILLLVFVFNRLGLRKGLPIEFGTSVRRFIGLYMFLYSLKSISKGRRFIGIVIMYISLFVSFSSLFQVWPEFFALVFCYYCIIFLLTIVFIFTSAPTAPTDTGVHSNHRFNPKIFGVLFNKNNHSKREENSDYEGTALCNQERDAYNKKDSLCQDSPDLFSYKERSNANDSEDAVYEDWNGSTS